MLTLVREVTGLVAKLLAKNKDDELLRTEGVFLRDRSVPYSVNRRFIRDNEFVEVALQVIALDQANGEGPTATELTL